MLTGVVTAVKNTKQRLTQTPISVLVGTLLLVQLFELVAYTAFGSEGFSGLSELTNSSLTPLLLWGGVSVAVSVVMGVLAAGVYPTLRDLPAGADKREFWNTINAVLGTEWKRFAIVGVATTLAVFALRIVAFSAVIVSGLTLSTIASLTTELLVGRPIPWSTELVVFGVGSIVALIYAILNLAVVFSFVIATDENLSLSLKSVFVPFVSLRFARQHKLETVAVGVISWGLTALSMVPIVVGVELYDTLDTLVYALPYRLVDPAMLVISVVLLVGVLGVVVLLQGVSAVFLWEYYTARQSRFRELSTLYVDAPIKPRVVSGVKRAAVVLLVVGVVMGGVSGVRIADPDFGPNSTVPDPTTHNNWTAGDGVQASYDAWEEYPADERSINGYNTQTITFLSENTQTGDTSRETHRFLFGGAAWYDGENEQMLLVTPTGQKSLPENASGDPPAFGALLNYYSSSHSQIFGAPDSLNPPYTNTSEALETPLRPYSQSDVGWVGSWANMLFTYPYHDESWTIESENDTHVVYTTSNPSAVKIRKRTAGDGFMRETQTEHQYGDIQDVAVQSEDMEAVYVVNRSTGHPESMDVTYTTTREYIIAPDDRETPGQYRVVADYTIEKHIDYGTNEPVPYDGGEPASFTKRVERVLGDILFFTN